MSARLIILTCLMGLAGCGYQQQDADADSAGYRWKSLYRDDVRTIAVPIFTNRDFYRGVEFSLAKAIVNQIETHTPYKVVDRERADTILEGQIVQVRTRTVSRDRNSAVPQEQLQSITVDFVWKDLRTGQILRQKSGFEETRVLYPTLGEGQFVGTQQAVETLALAIVEQLQADW